MGGEGRYSRPRRSARLSFLGRSPWHLPPGFCKHEHPARGPPPSGRDPTRRVSPGRHSAGAERILASLRRGLAGTDPRADDGPGPRIHRRAVVRGNAAVDMGPRLRRRGGRYARVGSVAVPGSTVLDARVASRRLGRADRRAVQFGNPGGRVRKEEEMEFLLQQHAIECMILYPPPPPLGFRRKTNVAS